MSNMFNFTQNVGSIINFRLNYLPFFFWQMQPKISEFIAQVLNDEDLKKLRSAIELMVHLGITISKEKYDIESLFFPDIQTLLCWKEWKNSIRITYGISKIMSLEYPKVLLLIENAQNNIEIEKKISNVTNNSNYNNIYNITNINNVANIKNPASLSEKAKEGSSIFSGFGQKKKHDEIGLTNQIKIRIKFKEGCIKGVKREVNLKDLL